MKLNFAMIKLIQIVFVLLCSGVVTNAHNEPLRKNASITIVRPRPTRTRTVAINDQIKGGYSNLVLTIGCAVAAAVVVVIVVSVVLRYKWQRKKRYADNVGPFSPNREINQVPCLPPYYTVHAVQPNRSPVIIGDNGSVDLNEDEQEPIGREICDPKSMSKEPLGKTVSMRPDGGVIQIDDIILNIGPGCLAKDTEITLIKDDQNIAFKSLLDLGLLDAAPRVVEFLPDGLKFLKPADLTIRFEKTVSDSELFILHGSYNRDYHRVVWELVTNDIEENTVEGVVNMKINGFSIYSWILAMRGTIARILSHLNHSFTCCAYAFYRRLPPMDTIDISVVLVSSFVDENKEEDIKQLKDHFKEGYVKGDKGMSKRVHTDRRLEMCLDFPGVESSPFSFEVDQPELDSVGFVIDHFKGTAIESPASGTVKISEVHSSVESELLWKLNIHEMEQEIRVEEAYVQSTEPDTEPQVVYRSTRLTNGEVNRLSNVVGVDWDSLAGLMDIPYSKREEIRTNHAKYPDCPSKAAHIFALFNGSQCFGRHILEKYFKELGRNDLKNEMRSVENENGIDEVDTSPPQIEVSKQTGTEEVETPPSPPEVDVNENVKLRNTPLSSREMFRLSQRIAVDWDSLAGLMDIAKERRDDIRDNTSTYNDNRSRAEKILSIFNHKEGFSRKKLAKCLEGIEKLDLIWPITTGEWRNL